MVAIAAFAQAAPSREFLLLLEPVRAAYLKSLVDSGELALAGQVLDPKGMWRIVIVLASDTGASAIAFWRGSNSVPHRFRAGTVTRGA